jgi:hypothetical protein
MTKRARSLSPFSLTPQRDVSGRRESVVDGMHIFGFDDLVLTVMSSCMEHTVQLGAGAFLKKICPNPSKFRNRLSTKNGIEDDDDNGEDDDDDDDNDGDAEFEDEDDEGMDDAAYEVEIDDGIVFDAGDTLGKLLACITQVRASLYLHLQ